METSIRNVRRIVNDSHEPIVVQIDMEDDILLCKSGTYDRGKIDLILPDNPPIGKEYTIKSIQYESPVTVVTIKSYSARISVSNDLCQPAKEYTLPDIIYTPYPIIKNSCVIIYTSVGMWDII